MKQDKSHEKNTHGQGSPPSKKDVVLRKSGNRPLLFLTGGVALALAAALGYFLLLPGGGETSPVVSGDHVEYPIELFKDGKARHFHLKTDEGMTVRYFILKDSGGVLRAALDACDVCWPAGKGYVQDSDQMICRNCGQRFASTKIGELKGGCNPVPLSREIRGEKLIIQLKNILAGKTYFDSRGGKS
jgi:hypothetical protein